MTTNANSFLNKTTLLRILCVLGWAIALYTVYHRSTLINSSSLESSFCNINSTFNCDKVALSEKSSLFGFPVGVFGMLFYSLLIFFSFKSKEEKDGELVNYSFYNMLIVFVSFIGLLFSAYQGFYMFTELKTYCLMCLALYGIDIAIFIISLLLLKNTLTKGAFKFSSSLLIIPIILLGVHLFVPEFFKTANSKASAENLPAMLNQYNNSPILDHQTEGYPGFKSPQAKIKIVEYADFQCPSCQMATAALKPLLSQYKSQIEYRFKHYPLDNNCNDQIKRSFHAYACQATTLAQCIFDKKGYDSFYNFKITAFKNQKKISPNNLNTWALEAGLTDQELKECSDDPQYLRTVVNSIKEANVFKISGTPAIYINGKKANYIDYSFYKSVFEQILKK